MTSHSLLPLSRANIYVYHNSFTIYSTKPSQLPISCNNCYKHVAGQDIHCTLSPGDISTTMVQPRATVQQHHQMKIPRFMTQRNYKLLICAIFLQSYLGRGNVGGRRVQREIAMVSNLSHRPPRKRQNLCDNNTLLTLSYYLNNKQYGWVSKSCTILQDNSFGDDSAPQIKTTLTKLQ